MRGGGGCALPARNALAGRRLTPCRPPAPRAARGPGLFLLCPPRLPRCAGVPRPRWRLGRRHLAARVFGPFLAAAAAAGVAHAVFLSVQGAGAHARLLHTRVEARLAASGLAWTVVRSAYFLQALARAPLRGALAAGRLALPAAGAAAAARNWADARDAGELAAHALLHPAASAGAVWTLAAERAGWADVAAGVAAATGRCVAVEAVPPLAWALRELRAGAPAAGVLAALLVHGGAALARPLPVCAGDFQAALGRAPRGLADFARDYAAAWAPPGGARPRGLPPAAAAKPPAAASAAAAGAAGAGPLCVAAPALVKVRATVSTE